MRGICIMGNAKVFQNQAKDLLLLDALDSNGVVFNVRVSIQLSVRPSVCLPASLLVLELDET